MDLPVGLNDIADLNLPGEVTLIAAGGGTAAYTWRYGDLSTVLAANLLLRTVTLPPDAPAAAVTVLTARLAAYGQPPSWDPAARQLVELAQSAVGVALADLTAGQRNALLALMLWDRRALGNDLTVRPLGEWVKRRPRDA